MLYTDCQGGRTAAIARHVSFAQITCFIDWWLALSSGYKWLINSKHERTALLAKLFRLTLSVMWPLPRKTLWTTVVTLVLSYYSLHQPRGKSRRRVFILLR